MEDSIGMWKKNGFCSGMREGRRVQKDKWGIVETNTETYTEPCEFVFSKRVVKLSSLRAAVEE